MKFMIAGGAGFLGRHLCKKLLDSGIQVICLDNLQTGSIENIAEFEQNQNFTFIEHDIRSALNQNLEVDYIYNLACPASPKKYQSEPISTIETCTTGVINLLDFALKKKIGFFHASTSEIYGDPLEHPQKESYFGNVNCFGPRSCYDEGKRCSETIIYDYFKKTDLDIKVVRIFNTYGPYMDVDDGRVVSNFIVQSLKGEDLTIYGDGKQTRSLCYVDDLLDGFESFRKFKDKKIGPVNLGNPSEITIEQLAMTIIKQTKSKSKPSFQKLPKDDPKIRKPDIAIAKELFSFSPSNSLESGLEKTIAYFKSKVQ